MSGSVIIDLFQALNRDWKKNVYKINGETFEPSLTAFPGFFLLLTGFLQKKRMIYPSVFAAPQTSILKTRTVTGIGLGGIWDSIMW